MTFSQEQYRENIGKNETLPIKTRSYFKQRFQQQAFARLAKAFADRAENFGITKSGLSALLGRDKGQVNRLLAHPTNMTFDTYAELALALNLEPAIVLHDLCEAPRHNYQHESFTWHSEGTSIPAAIHETSNTVVELKVLEPIQ